MATRTPSGTGADRRGMVDAHPQRRSAIKRAGAVAAEPLRVDGDDAPHLEVNRAVVIVGRRRVELVLKTLVRIKPRVELEFPTVRAGLGGDHHVHLAVMVGPLDAVAHVDGQGLRGEGETLALDDDLVQRGIGDGPGRSGCQPPHRDHAHRQPRRSAHHTRSRTIVGRLYTSRLGTVKPTREEPVHEWPSAALSVGLACSRTTQYAPRARPPSALHLAIPEQAPPPEYSHRLLPIVSRCPQGIARSSPAAAESPSARGA